MKKIFTVISFLMIYGLSASSVEAYTVPTFPSCTNPSGNIKVEYVEGLHAIVGENTLRSGSDKVYSLFDGNTLQCFCPSNSEGIQTNWWKINGNLSQNDINSLKNQGWNYIPSGRDWGLSSDPYLAKNENYNCKQGGGGGSSSGVGGGGVLSSFAPTGDNWMLFVTLIFGVSLILAATALRKK